MAKRAPSVPELSTDQARRIFLRAQGLIGPRERDPGAMLRRLGFVQLDTISVLARSHELVAYSRIGPIARANATQTGLSSILILIRIWLGAMPASGISSNTITISPAGRLRATTELCKLVSDCVCSAVQCL